jgi:uncharacterized protein (DUF433 family)/DNA-binding transcriptional MerR regulator
MGATVHAMPPRGHYLAHEVGRLVGVSGNAIGQWARRGLIRSSQSTGAPRVYSFQDVAEAMLVHELLERGAEHRDIRRTIENLRRDYRDWPLTRARLSTSSDGRVYAEDGEATYDVGNRGWQQIAVEDLERITGLLERGGWAARSLDLQHIEVNPNRLGGRPVIRGTRVPVELVAEVAAMPEGRTTLHEGYELNDAEIDEAVAWTRKVEGFEVAA